ncbi:hypothetical protein SS50377_27558 [Spironucleus salmonicida]|uniref:Uncharacterized protein n=1 Tax=Spironucleus salmonicida TaxID=348837 RepID=V6M0M5_9EUKA|nr:hypothetical protein SS50377_27558 [Spironucleus salmonicida]|eukprot:EST46664.1 hypothetical protein SS50377_13469 [Spironucleus salmonicida]
MPDPCPEDIMELQREIEKKEQESKDKGLPFNRAALLRRIATNKGRYYDSAEFVLKNGFPQQNQKHEQIAYFQQNLSNASQSRAVKSRFHTVQPNENDDDDDDN